MFILTSKKDVDIQTFSITPGPISQKHLTPEEQYDFAKGLRSDKLSKIQRCELSKVFARLGHSFNSLEKWDRAEKCFLEAALLSSESHGSNSPLYAGALADLAAALYNSSSVSAAHVLELFFVALGLARSTIPTDTITCGCELLPGEIEESIEESIKNVAEDIGINSTPIVITTSPAHICVKDRISVSIRVTTVMDSIHRIRVSPHVMVELANRFNKISLRTKRGIEMCRIVWTPCQDMMGVECSMRLVTSSAGRFAICSGTRFLVDLEVSDDPCAPDQKFSRDDDEEFPRVTDVFKITTKYLSR